MLLGAATLALNSVLVKNLLSNLKNRRHLKSHEDKIAPSTLNDFTLAIPLRNEAANLKKLLPLLSAQYSTPARTLFLDDQSTDDSLEILQAFQEKNSHVEILNGTKPPYPFNGKVWALKQLLEKVETEFVIFMDADVQMTHPRALFSLSEEARPLKQGKYSFASVFPRSKAKLDTSILVNQIFVQLYYFLPAHWTDSQLMTMSTGSGRVMVINAQKLREYNFLDKIADTTHDGLRLAQLFKAKERSVAFFDGGAFFQSDYYPSLVSAFKGLSRSSFETRRSQWATLAFSVIVFWAFVLPFVFLPFAIINPCWIAALFVILWGQYRLMQELDLNPVFVATTPIAASLLCLTHLWGAIKDKMEIQEEWRGRLLR
ncbi:MAG: glycosyltransferase family 2 protein [Bdellovibrionota bacterium]